MEKRVDLGLLLSFYGAMLTERQQEMLRLYYEEDLSLSEIAALCGMTRQGAHDAIRRGEAQLESLESRLGLRARWGRMCRGLAKCREAMGLGHMDEAVAIIDELISQEEEQNGL